MNCPICKSSRVRVTYRNNIISIYRCLCCSMLFREPYNVTLKDKCKDCRSKCLDENKCSDIYHSYYLKNFLSLRLQLEKIRIKRIGLHMQH